VQQILTDFWAAIKPPRFFSWQSLLLASVVMWLVAVLGGIFNPDVRQGAATWSWLLLTLGGIFWSLQKRHDPKAPLWQQPLIVRGVSLSPWLAGALTSSFVYRFLSRIEGYPLQQALYLAILVWPLVSALLWLVPEYMAPDRLGLEVPPKRRPQLTIVLLSHFLLCFWIRFGFMLYDWIGRDPVLQAQLEGRQYQVFTNSMFVVPLQLFQ